MRNEFVDDGKSYDCEGGLPLSLAF